MATGVLLGLRSVGWRATTVLAAETEGTASFAAAWAAGELVMLDRVSGLATTLGARCIAQGVLDLAKQHKRVRPGCFGELHSHLCCLSSCFCDAFALFASTGWKIGVAYLHAILWV